MSNITVERAAPRPPAIENINIACATQSDDKLAIYKSACKGMIMFNSREGARTCIISVRLEDIPALLEAIKELADQ